jgi:hypothetical protein
MRKELLDSEERSLLQVIVANPGSAEAAAALAELEIRSRKVSEAINRRMLTLTIVLALAAIGQVSTSLIPIFFPLDRGSTCTCKHNNGEHTQASPPGRNEVSREQEREAKSP